MLKLHNLCPGDHLVFPEDFAELGLDSSALEVLTDFRRHRPLILEASTSVRDAERLMHRAHVRLKLVVNAQRDLIGLLDADDLYGDSALEACAGRDRDDVSVQELMRPRSALKALEYSRLAQASVADLVEALQHEGVLHCLVVDSPAQQIRGVISATELASRLHLRISIEERASFLDIFRSVSHRM